MYREHAARLLKSMGDTLAERLISIAKNNAVNANTRNHSVLIHGFVTAAPADENSLKYIFLQLEKILIDDNPKFNDNFEIAKSLNFKEEKYNKI